MIHMTENQRLKFKLEWAKVVHLLQKSGKDLSQIKIATTPGHHDNAVDLVESEE